MLLRFIIQNFRSFYSPVQFDMFPNPRRTSFPEHIIEGKVPLLKQAAIYGANGSGKSNFIKALSFLKRFVTDKNFIKKDQLDKSKFRLIQGGNKEPISLIVEFFNAEQYYIYEIAINSESIEKEALYLSGIGEDNVLLFLRTGNQVKMRTEQAEDVRFAIEKLLETNPMSSLFALNKEFPILKDKEIEGAFDWFFHELEIVKPDSFIPILIELMASNQPLMEFVNNVFEKLDTGITRLKINKKAEDQSFDDEVKSLLNKEIGKDQLLTRMRKNRNMCSLSLENGKKILKEFLFEQSGKDGYAGEMDIAVQSDGTVRLLTLIPAFYSAMKGHKTVCVDEIDNSIHPLLIRELIALFSGSPASGQLIFTTHEVCLLDQKKLLRPDEVWFTEKHEGETCMYSLNDFKEHNTISIENGYLGGRYGGIPFLGLAELLTTKDD
ncbi:ATP-binding protein [Massilibacteroides sp.]|uniref:AAA family ATPase n=1 Tax=Massilibacteroides sp. TaxID=2034766 RepID=UPI00260DEF0D|nr:ATP-binding protein [Massilibacteroides sp.]MDD4515967.1 AAA family ATPase [Massilibacteroides sp.]